MKRLKHFSPTAFPLSTCYTGTMRQVRQSSEGRSGLGTVTIILALALLISGGANIYLLHNTYEEGRVTSVPDGDSIQLSDGRRVRLLSIDAPEKDRCMAGEARERLVSLALGKHVRLKDTVTDGYGRLLANVIVEEFDAWRRYLAWFMAEKLGFSQGAPMPDLFVNRVLVAEGLARFTSVKSSYFDVLKDAASRAKEAKLGIYSRACRSTEPVGDCLIKGNVRAGVKLYHLPNCYNYDQVIVDEAFGDQWFCTETEAKAAGFTRTTTRCPK